MFEDGHPLFDAELETLAVRAGHVRTHEGEQGEPIFTTSSYVFDSAASAAARFSGDEPGNVYSRYTNPTVRVFEDRLAALEQGEAAVATASGMSAILSTFFSLLGAGDHVVASRSIFGTTSVMFSKYFSKFGIGVDQVALTDYAAWEASIKPETKILFAETPSNPLNEIADIEKLAELAHKNGCLLIIDNCFCSPALQKPLLLGADIVIHSATKFLDGQGRCLGGAVVGSRAMMDDVLGFVRTCGPTMSAFNAWVFLKGLETLSLRMKAHSENTLALATWLESHSAVEKVFYCGLPSHPNHDLASRQQSGFGGVLSFKVKGGRKEAWKVLDAVQIMSLTANLGDAKTTIVHPATTTHGRLSDEQKADAGITESLIRVAVGLESVNDLKKDLMRGLGEV